MAGCQSELLPPPPPPPMMTLPPLGASGLTSTSLQRSPKSSRKNRVLVETTDSRGQPIKERNKKKVLLVSQHEYTCTVDRSMPMPTQLPRRNRWHTSLITLKGLVITIVRWELIVLNLT